MRRVFVSSIALSIAVSCYGLDTLKSALTIDPKLGGLKAISYPVAAEGEESEEGDDQEEKGKKSPQVGSGANNKATAIMQTMPFTSNTIADIAALAAPSVVNIEVRKSEEATVSSIPLFEGFPFNDPHDFFYYNGRRIMPNSPDMSKLIPKSIKMRRPAATGTGFVVRQDGYIMTNAHVVKGAQEIKVTLNDKRSFIAKTVGSDNFSDLALLKIDAKDLPVLKFGTSQNLRPGEFAIAIGSPFGYDHTVTLGIISAVGRTVDDINGNINFIQTDAAINPGNSGGPLLNLKGEVVGVNTAIKDNAQNIGFSIPVDVARNVAEDLINNRTIERPWLGIGMSELKESQAKTMGLPVTTRGVLVEKVYKDSPAEDANLEPGDILLKLEGKTVLTPRDVQNIVRAKRVKDKLTFEYLRSGSQKSSDVTIGAYPDYIDLKETAAPPSVTPNNTAPRPVSPNSNSGNGKAAPSKGK